MLFRKKKQDKHLVVDLTAEISLWNNKLKETDIKHKYQSYYIMGVVGGLRLALRRIERDNEKGNH